MRSPLLILILLLTFSALPEIAAAQASVTFNINLKPQLKDSTFIPTRDFAGVIGNLHPFRRNTPIEMVDEEPIDSIYTATIDFPGYQTGKSLQYNFILRTEGRDSKELRPRILQLREGDMILDALYFNAYAF